MMAELLDGAEHEELFSGASLLVGKIHWYIQKATIEMETKRDPEGIHKSGKVIDLAKFEPNEFSREVGSDEIRWWVFKKERNQAELLKRTLLALDKAQILKGAAHSLRGQYDVPTYQDLVRKIKDFTVAHNDQIQILHDYVLWLHEKDVLAPVILATFRVWGSTRLADRRVEVSADAPKQDKEELHRCTEIALGLLRRGGYAIYQVYSDLSSQIADSIDPENPDYYQPIKVPERQLLVVRTAYEVLDELATYFELLRQSLRNILTEIEEYQEPQHLVDSEPFWAAFIHAAMERPVEHQLWDFKETLSMWITHIRQNQVDFCEKVAAFANAGGGALIIGVTDKPPREIRNIDDLENKLKSTREVITKRLSCETNCVCLVPIRLPDENGVAQNCLVVAVAQTKDAVSVWDNDDIFTFPVRVETGLARVDLDTLNRRKATVPNDNFAFIHRLSEVRNEH